MKKLENGSRRPRDIVETGVFSAAVPSDPNRELARRVLGSQGVALSPILYSR